MFVTDIVTKWCEIKIWLGKTNLCSALKICKTLCNFVNSCYDITTQNKNILPEVNT